MEKTQIDLIILSPSPEVNKLTFPAISTTTTIGELRERISAAAVSHPPPTRQRLIYRGHALIDAKKTLKEVFTQDIINSSNTLSLHLVLPPDVAAHSSRSSTPASVLGQGQHSHTPQHVHGSSDIGGSTASPQQVANSENVLEDAVQVNGSATLQQHASPPPQTYHGHGHHHPQMHAHGHFPLGQLPTQDQQTTAQIFALNQQIAAQLATINNNPTLQSVQWNQIQGQPVQQSALTFNQPPFSQLVPQQHYHPGGAGVQQGIPNSSPFITSSHTQSAPSPRVNPPAQQGSRILPAPSVSSNANTVVREGVGPNGERWQMIIQSGPINTTPTTLASTRPNNSSPQPSNAIRDRIGHNVALSQILSNLSAIEAALANNNPPPETTFDQARRMLNDIPGIQEEAHSLARRTNDLAERASHMRRDLHNNFTREANERAAAHRAARGAGSSGLYVLSSPSGPQALLVSPSGLYFTPWQLPTIGVVNPYPSLDDSSNISTQTQSSTQNNIVGRQQLPAEPVQVVHMHHQAAQQAGAPQAAQIQQHEAHQARDLLRILLPLGGHLWLMIRLFGFVYFFTAGAGWRRTILFGLIAILVFVVQTALFRPVILGIWDPIRRHAEGLVPLAGNERPHAGAAVNHDDMNAAGIRPANREPTPQEAAERLLRERERRDGTFVRQNIRRIERAIALFVASLVPGVGERHIAAREAAEAARQAEVREREERARRESEAARQQHDARALGLSAVEGNSAIAGANVESTAPSGEDAAAQRPLVEI